jgi:hypothetical protein
MVDSVVTGFIDALNIALVTVGIIEASKVYFTLKPLWLYGVISAALAVLFAYIYYAAPPFAFQAALAIALTQLFYDTLFKILKKIVSSLSGKERT